MITLGMGDGARRQINAAKYIIDAYLVDPEAK